MKLIFKVFSACFAISALFTSFEAGYLTGRPAEQQIVVHAEDIKDVEFGTEKNEPELEALMNIHELTETEKEIETEQIETVAPEPEPVETYLDAVVEPEPVYEPVIYTPTYSYSALLNDDEINLIAQLTMAEVGNQPEYTQRLVIDTILNRIDSAHFPNSVYDVIYSPGQYEVVSNGYIYQCAIEDSIRQLVIEETNTRTDYSVIYFNTLWYCTYGVPMMQLGPVFFSACQY